MIKKTIWILILQISWPMVASELTCVPQRCGIGLNEIIGTLLLSSSYYSGIEVYMQNYTVYPSNFPKDEIRIACTLGSFLTQVLGNAVLAQSMLRSAYPWRTMMKFHTSAFCLALGAYQIKMAHYFKDNEDERDRFIGYAAACSAMGGGLLGWALHDVEES